MLVGFFIAILVPAAILVSMALDQLKWEVFHRHHTLAREFVERLDGRFLLAVQNEDLRSLDDYAFAVPQSNSAQTLSVLPVQSSVPGVIGYFQVGPRGEFSTPLLPSTANFTAVEKARVYASLADLSQRTQISSRIFEILSRNQLVRNSRSDESGPVVQSELSASDQAFADPESNATTRRREATEISRIAQDQVRQETDMLSSDPESPLLDSLQSRIRQQARRKSENAAELSPSSRETTSDSASGSAASDSIQVQSNFDQLRSARGREQAEKKQRNKLGRVEDIVLEQAYQGRINEQERADTESDPMEAQSLEVEPRPVLKDSAEATTTSVGASKPETAKRARAALPPVPKSPAGKLGTKRQTNAVRKNTLQRDPNIGFSNSSSSANSGAGGASIRRDLLDKAARAAAGTQTAAPLALGAADQERITTFEHETEPSTLAMLGDGQLVLFRNVWRSGERYIQGALFDWERFVEQSIESEFRRSPLARVSRLAVAYEGEVRRAFETQGGRSRYIQDSDQLSGTLLYRARLSGAFSDLELIFTVTSLPLGSSALVVVSGAAALGLVMFFGCLMMYRLGAKQIELRQQQQDFVSAVSHELRTPLTSIRMYGELLREGWASEERKQDYYKFIHDESERLSRLIENVLQLARMERNDLRPSLSVHRVAQLDDHLRSKVAAIADSHGFALRVELSELDGEATVKVDLDFFSQIVINLADNAVKFSAAAQRKELELRWRRERVGGRDEVVVLSVRDFGPGIDPDQIGKIFRLFYRPGDELTRETVGTGIGLALVNQLARAMGGRVDAKNRDPGAQFEVYLPAQ